MTHAQPIWEGGKARGRHPLVAAAFRAVKMPSIPHETGLPQTGSAD
jgi:hypothetical protein